jgi:putative transposase
MGTDSEKFKNKYRIPSARLQTWNYGWDAAYFITICTKNREHYFGEIVDGKMELSKIGVIANVLWFEIKNHADNLKLGEFIVMPNHIHGILILDSNLSINNQPEIVANQSMVEINQVFEPMNLEIDNKSIGGNRFQNQGANTISSIVGSYKAAVTKHVNRLGFESSWQTRFHDHIIRSEKDFNRISNYIANNPLTWKEDKFYS